jgi:cation transport regulator ChaC
MDQQDNDIYMFAYGYNHPVKVASLLNIPLNELLPKCIPCTLKGYKRVFAGEDDDFDNKSVATIVKDSEGIINSYAFTIKQSQVKHIDVFEAYPIDYDRVVVQCIGKDQQIFDAIVYVMNNINKFVHPSEEYLKGVAQTMAAHYYLSGLETNYKAFSIEIISACRNEVENIAEIKLEIEEYHELIQDKLVR